MVVVPPMVSAEVLVCHWVADPTPQNGAQM
jgi:hypothetical protein